MVQLGVVLEGFPDQVVLYVSDPRTGIQRRSKWPPAISEVVDACEDYAEHLERLKKPRVVLQKVAAPLLSERPDGYLANVFVPEGHAKYDGFVEWSKSAERPYWLFGKASDGRNGIWINSDVWGGALSTTRELGE